MMESLLSFFFFHVGNCPMLPRLCSLLLGQEVLVGGGCGMSSVGAGDVDGEEVRGASSPSVSVIA